MPWMTSTRTFSACAVRMATAGDDRAAAGHRQCVPAGEPPVQRRFRSGCPLWRRGRAAADAGCSRAGRQFLTGVSPDELLSLSIDSGYPGRAAWSILRPPARGNAGIETLDLETLATALGMSDESAAQLSASAEDTWATWAMGGWSAQSGETSTRSAPRSTGCWASTAGNCAKAISTRAARAAERSSAQPGDALEVSLWAAAGALPCVVAVDQASTAQRTGAS